jgi:hypothetical protein
MCGGSKGEGYQVEESCNRMDDEERREGIAGSRGQVPIASVAIGEEAAYNVSIWVSISGS